MDVSNLFDSFVSASQLTLRLAAAFWPYLLSLAISGYVYFVISSLFSAAGV